jgi:aspartate-semialdehyde dehydrogenase
MRVAIVGATGAVGQELLRVLEARNFPVGHLLPLASARSVGTRLAFRGESVTVQEATVDAFDGVDVAFFSAGASRSCALVPEARKRGAVVIDNSSAFRMMPEVPLAVPEINLTESDKAKTLYAVPNCTAIILTMAVAPLRQLGVMRRLIVSTYQSASGGGAGMMRYLEQDTEAFLSNREGMPPEDRPDGLPAYAFNVFSHNTPIDARGRNEEEAKVISETRKILGEPNLHLNVTCVRVPVLRAHCESVCIEFEEYAPPVELVRQTLEFASGLAVVDDRQANQFPNARLAAHTDDVLVGRIRHDGSDPRLLNLWIAGDQLRKGAALNAVQIAEWKFRS